MGAFSIGGLSSGLDTKSIIAQLVAIDSKPKVKLEWQSQRETARLNAWKDLETKLTTLKNSSQALMRFDTFDKTAFVANFTGVWSGTASDTSVVSAKVTPPVQPAPPAAQLPPPTNATYDINVIQRAQNEVTRSSAAFAGVAADETFTITQGGNTWNVALTAGDDLATIAAKINGTSGVGVVASAAGGVLQLTGIAKGGAAAFDVSSSGSTAGALGLQETQHAQDAQFLVDGVLHQSASNKGVTGVIPYVSLNLDGLGESTLSVEQKTAEGASVDKAFEDAVVKKVTEFVSAYNSVLDQVHQKTQLESRVTTPANKSAGMSLGEFLAGPLARNTQYGGVATELRALMAGQLGIADDPGTGADESTAAAGSRFLGDIGLSTSFDIKSMKSAAQGRITIDETKLRAALQTDAGIARVKDMLTRDDASGTTPTENGFARRAFDFADLQTAITKDEFQRVTGGGATSIAANSASESIKRLQQSIARATDQIDMKRLRYEKQYTAMETMLGKLQSQNSWVSSQFASMSG
ncbi:MAG: hypothetical protein JWO69_1631 [Thermoleophilia bacterium]|nr:hypothetical protein [Thermoleophilia bacterium]